MICYTMKLNIEIKNGVFFTILVRTIKKYKRYLLYVIILKNMNK